MVICQAILAEKVGLLLSAQEILCLQFVDYFALPRLDFSEISSFCVTQRKCVVLNLTQDSFFLQTLLHREDIDHEGECSDVGNTEFAI